MITRLLPIFVICFSVATAFADDRDRAARLFAEAAAARDEGRWVAARALLEESLAVFPHFPTAWNLVAALEETDGLPEAERLLEQMLAGSYGTLSTAERGSVTERLERVAGQLGTLVALSPPDLAAAVAVDDGEPIRADASGRIVVRLVPGSRRVVATALERTEQHTVTVVAGETRTVRFELPSEPTPGDVSLELVSGAANDSTLWESPWLWIGVGAVILGTLTAVLLLSSGSEDPVPGDFVSPPL